MAPMVRISDVCSRLTAMQLGCKMTWTEVLVDRAVLKATECSLIDGPGPRRLEYRIPDAKPLLVLSDTADPVILQLASSDPKQAVAAALYLVDEVSGVDINMGCKQHFTASGGMGVDLIKDKKAREQGTALALVRALRTALPDQCPVSAKLRLLPVEPASLSEDTHAGKKPQVKDVDIQATAKFCCDLLSAGCSFLSMHCRLTSETRSEPVRMESFPLVLEAMRALGGDDSRVVYNGGLLTSGDIARVRGVVSSPLMLARGAQLNLGLFASPERLSLREREDTVRRLVLNGVLYGTALHIIRRLICSMLPGRRGKRAVSGCREIPELLRLLNLPDTPEVFAKWQHHLDVGATVDAILSEVVIRDGEEHVLSMPGPGTDRESKRDREPSVGPAIPSSEAKRRAQDSA
ncbi:tRNA-dihydrouridine synthase [Kipferlia bialata]|uniref:tRNA-dihydrouridine synthase n=1 Tax=Kipferlia bialata TaxID=797122 RepID=A0A9K3D2K2_9EUKA|nr:tRNA-dihydrouridine synthase [Kipferlia bialata]|eukprot:g9971.t1